MNNTISLSQNYVVLSLELHLFFARIMKEHALFLEAGFLKPNAQYAQKAEHLKREFEALLADAVRMSSGVVRNDILESGEIVTDFTREAEQKTSHFTGILIDSQITVQEKNLCSMQRGCISCDIKQHVSMLNRRACCLLNEIITFKEKVLHEVLECNMFTANYPLLIEHIIREAKLYLMYVQELELNGTICHENMRNVEMFWNQIMMEHAMFIRGLLDPSEAKLIDTADDFAKAYELLLKEASVANDMAMGKLTSKTINETTKYQGFKTAGTMGINECKIKSVILPLLADHVLREANHYLRILKQ